MGRVAAADTNSDEIQVLRSNTRRQMELLAVARFMVAESMEW